MIGTTRYEVSQGDLDGIQDSWEMAVYYDREPTERVVRENSHTLLIEHIERGQVYHRTVYEGI